MREEVQAWRRLALLALLKRAPPEGHTAAELADSLGALASSEDVPVHLAGGIDASTVFGILRQFEKQGLVCRGGSKPHPRAGRDSPAWVLVDPASVIGEIPTFPPADRAPARRMTGPHQVVEVDPAEHEAFRTTLDELAGITARHRDELNGLTTRHARELESCLTRIAARMEPYRGG